ncbi:TPA: restriction endonuclease subunit S [Klebsiella pneumoniae]|uniref:restriction endonuclease subunit S n=1 Tax=Klebsiella pneumoniae TaxID=573 RepID=UPI000E2C2947|nr:restriction endonuclease subunit S [Klebsiella pneumoniae]HBY0570165.1 restriction endonuclease subunit S [Klebsiella pneumoniae subsp. pneumoniae]EIX9703967.1 restriction endonuclease subunit S [Klebsiella pneumoniae]EKZ9845261.1 restriction endonuclease subunit S [Klebsiella pneumoniae]MCE0290157.1 restriction endonuclease subunit S [Klebsiella pneumoniae]SYS91245.1 type I restriction-modification system [Klebsiella pneumoniae]
MSEGKLPEGWVKSELDNILLTIIGGGTPSKAIPEYYQGDIPWMSVKDMNKHTLTDTIDHITNDAVENSSTNIIPAGTPIIATRMSLGKIVTASFDSAINQDLKALFLSSGVERNFFIHWYRSQAQLIESLGTGTTVKGIRLEVLKALSINLPPFFEQKIIAEKLDTLLAQVDSTKARLEQIPQILKRFRQVVLAAIVNGKLSTNTEQWKVYSLKNLCVSISDGDHQAPPKSETGIPFLVISDVNKGKIDLENVSRWVPESYYLALKEIRKPSLNDILYTVTGSFGIPVVVNTTKPFCFQRHIAIIKPNSNLINYKFLLFYLESPQIFKHASDVATGTAQKTVSLSSLRNFELSVPSLKEQAVIVHRVEQLFAYADTIEKQVNNALTRVNNLTQSILAKAFRGELTAQWRAENPSLISGENSATALLERIKAERAASSGKKSSRKKA